MMIVGEDFARRRGSIREKDEYLLSSSWMECSGVI